MQYNSIIVATHKRSLGAMIRQRFQEGTYVYTHNVCMLGSPYFYGGPIIIYFQGVVNELMEFK